MDTKQIKIKVTCAFCRKHFKRCPSLAKGKNLFCSIQCKAEFQRLQKGKKANKAICIICGIPYFVKPFHVKTRKTCSGKCRSVLLSSRRGSETPNWKGGWKHARGYIMEGKKLQHRRIMEDHIGRPLTDDEEVHHINFIKTDNRLKNLKLLSVEEHRKLHAKLNKLKRHGKSAGNKTSKKEKK